MHQLIACLMGGAVHQPFGGNATTDQIYVAASWVGTVELAIVAAVGLVLWFRQRKFAQRI